MKLLPTTLLALSLCACQASTKPNAQTVIEAHVAAFNAKDIEAMGVVQHPDIEWLSVVDSEVLVEVQGRKDLATIMRDYMAASPTTVGTLRDWSHNGDYISVTETASWTTDAGEPRAQSALTVYQMEDGLIRRVWYYPSVSETE